MSNTANTKNIELPVGFETDPAEDELAREKIRTARINMLFKCPWYGAMTVRLPVVNADAWLPTAATDGKYLYFNSKFINMLDDQEMIFLIGHEVLHCVYEHLARSRDQMHHPIISNIAADYAVNRDLVDNNVGRLITTVPALYDEKYTDWVMEEIYDDLMKEAQKNAQELMSQVLDEHLDQDDSAGGGQDGGTGDGDDGGEGDGDDGDNESNSQGGSGQPKSGSGPGLTKDSRGNLVSTQRPVYTDSEKKQIRERMRDALISSQEHAKNGKNAGNAPAGVLKIIKELTEPLIDWRDLLEMNMMSMLDSDFTFMKQSRKGRAEGIILPGMKPEETIDVCISVDMSGSISDEQAKDFFSEVKGIMESFTSFRIRVWCFDAEVHNYAEFTENNLDELMDYQPMGGGGTLFMCNWEFMKEHEIEPERFVMFTDGYPCDSWGDPDYCETVFIIHGPTSIKPSFGEYAHYDGKHAIDGAQRAA